MKSVSYFSIEVKSTSGWDEGSWNPLYVIYNKEDALRKAVMTQNVRGKRNVRIFEVTTKRIPIKA